jgi:DNA-binding response OmpR family regulator
LARFLHLNLAVDAPMKTILAVDDDKWVPEVLRDALTIKGYQVLTAGSADEALRVLKEKQVDLVLLDLNMPGKNGFALLREMQEFGTIPALFVSGCSRSFSPTSEGFTDIWEHEFAEGTTDILYKPFSIDLLYEKVEALIGNSGTVQNEPAL